jgi:hypothetical protein
MTTDTKIALKTLAELESDINDGNVAHAAGVNHGSCSVLSIAPGRHCIHLEANGCGESTIQTAEDKPGTLMELIERIEWDDTESLDIEFRTYLGQQIWFVGNDVDPWDVDAFVWPPNYIPSIEVIWASGAAAKANQRVSFNTLLGDVQIDL